MSICLVMVLGTGIICRDPRPEMIVIDTSCQAYKPIEWSVNDTARTIVQVREHNAVFDGLCADAQTTQQGIGMR